MGVGGDKTSDLWRCCVGDRMGAVVIIACVRMILISFIRFFFSLARSFPEIVKALWKPVSGGWLSTSTFFGFPSDAIKVGLWNAKDFE